ncbi:No apical meristem (NAM) protein [Corchorus capsularis]|uniref:No apical meristem (NAM) protein n=1 Tax=Corchorus capsularis TaxID=210143 RepID=A0A1R3IIJ3_COCAP|nr:No apical meristem (NAM) protein [Corchorus capsularis]
MENIAPGFRFYPTEEELVSFYLHHKLERKREDLNRTMDQFIPTVNIYEFNPCDLPQLSWYLSHKETEQWFFFVPKQEGEARGGRPNRLTPNGYWKATGSPGFVYSSSNNRPIGFKRTMVFYYGRAPNGSKTEWKMNEYKVIDESAPHPSDAATPPTLDEFCLCRIYKKTKCVRSFDRRPVRAAGRGRVLQICDLPQPRAADNHRQGDQVTLGAIGAASNDQQSGSPLVAERNMSSSQDSSSSGDHGNNIYGQTGESSNTSSPLMFDYDESFWCLDGFWENIP